jgi:hypothetical protein
MQFQFRDLLMPNQLAKPIICRNVFLSLSPLKRTLRKNANIIMIDFVQAVFLLNLLQVLVEKKKEINF